VVYGKRRSTQKDRRNRCRHHPRVLTLPVRSGTKTILLRNRRFWDRLYLLWSTSTTVQGKRRETDRSKVPTTTTSRLQRRPGAALPPILLNRCIKSLIPCRIPRPVYRMSYSQANGTLEDASQKFSPPWARTYRHNRRSGLPISQDSVCGSNQRTEPRYPSRRRAL
jgi:hypothetical protein